MPTETYYTVNVRLLKLAQFFFSPKQFKYSSFNLEMVSPLPMLLGYFVREKAFQSLFLMDCLRQTNDYLSHKVSSGENLSEIQRMKKIYRFKSLAILKFLIQLFEHFKSPFDATRKRST